jgi:hypothetical protein
MVKLLDGMLYKCKFDEQWLLLDDVCRYSLDEITYSSQSQGKWAKQEMPCCMPSTSKSF